MMTYFDAPGTKEVFNIIKPFRHENRVGISIYPATGDKGKYLYSLIGFDTVKQKMTYKVGRRTNDIELEHIHSANDALIALSNAKMHDMCLDFEITMLFDDDGNFSSVEFFKEVSDAVVSRNQSTVKYFADERTMEIVSQLKPIASEECVGILVFPADQNETAYICRAIKYGFVDKAMKYGVREGSNNVKLTTIQNFDDLVLAMSNAKVHHGLERFEMHYGADKRFGLPALMLYKV